MCTELGQDLMVRPDDDVASFHPGSPGVECENDSEEFLFLCGILNLGGGEFMGFISQAVKDRSSSGLVAE